MLCSLCYDIKAYYLHVALCDHSIYLTHTLHISCLLDAPRNFSNDLPQVRTVYYTIIAFNPSLIIFYFH
jgi:hypothetical protein